MSDSHDSLILRLFDNLETRLMSVLTDKLAEVRTELTAALARVQEDVDTLKARVVELEALVAKGVATDEDMAELESIRAELAALDPTKPDVLPPAE